MQAVFSKIGLVVLWVVSWLPLWVLYRFADVSYRLIRLVGYRRDIINENLRYSFPNATREELRLIRIEFYKHFSDLFVETIKLQHMSEAEMRKRVVFENIEFLDKAFDEGKDVVAVMGHYNNWEWVPSINLHTKALGCDVYRPLKNKVFDKYMLQLRSVWGNENYTMKSTLKEIVRLRKNGQRFVLGLIADQSPAQVEIQYWTNFLNQNTAILTGPEKIAKMMKAPVVFLDMQKIKRGYYKVSIVPLVEDANEAAENEITEKHVRYLEKMIVERPEFWLWSHKRWKYSEVREIKQKKIAHA